MVLAYSWVYVQYIANRISRRLAVGSASSEAGGEAGLVRETKPDPGEGER